jgi:hypothetical protein
MPRNIAIEVSLVKDGPGALAAHTAEIHKLIKHTRESIVAIGEHLAAVRELLDHGEWLHWLEAEYEWSDQTARRFIHVYDMSRDAKFNTFVEFDLPVSVFYKLAAPKAEVARTEIAELIESGVTPTKADVQEVLARHTIHKTDTAAAEPAIASAPEKPAPPIEFPDIPPFLQVNKSTGDKPDKPDDVPTDSNDLEAQRLFAAWQGLEPAACTKLFDLIGAATVLEHGSREFHKDLRAALPSNPFARLAGMTGVEIADELSERLSRATINTMIKQLQTLSGTKATDGKPFKKAINLESNEFCAVDPRNSRSRH